MHLNFFVKEVTFKKVEHRTVIPTQTLNLTFLYETVSTLKPTVGIVVTDCPNLSLYKIANFRSRI